MDQKKLHSEIVQESGVEIEKCRSGIAKIHEHIEYIGIQDVAKIKTVADFAVYMAGVRFAYDESAETDEGVIEFRGLDYIERDMVLGAAMKAMQDMCQQVRRDTGVSMISRVKKAIKAVKNDNLSKGNGGDNEAMRKIISNLYNNRVDDNTDAVAQVIMADSQDPLAYIHTEGLKALFKNRTTTADDYETKAHIEQREQDFFGLLGDADVKHYIKQYKQFNEVRRLSENHDNSHEAYIDEDALLDFVVLPKDEGSKALQEEAKVQHERLSASEKQEYDPKRFKILDNIASRWNAGKVRYAYSRPRSEAQNADFDIMRDYVVLLLDDEQLATTSAIAMVMKRKYYSTTVVREDVSDISWQRMLSLSKKDAAAAGARNIKMTYPKEKDPHDYHQSRIEHFLTCEAAEFVLISRTNAHGKAVSGSIEKHMGNISIDSES